jgi:hypothetical protein
MMEAAIIMDDPMATVYRRPIRSETYEAGMKDGRPPRLIPAMMRPRILVDIDPKSSLTALCQKI